MKPFSPRRGSFLMLVRTCIWAWRKLSDESDFLMICVLRARGLDASRKKVSSSDSIMQSLCVTQISFNICIV